MSDLKHSAVCITNVSPMVQRRGGMGGVWRSETSQSSQTSLSEGDVWWNGSIGTCLPPLTGFSIRKLGINLRERGAQKLVKMLDVQSRNDPSHLNISFIACIVLVELLTAPRQCTAAYSL